MGARRPDALRAFHRRGDPASSAPARPAARSDGQVGYDSYVERVVLIDPDSGAMRAITPASFYAFEYDWSPDAREIAYTSAPPPGDNSSYHARLYAVSAATGAVREIYRPHLQIAVPRWSPDGRTIAFIEGLMSDKGSTGGDIWTVPSAGGAARNLTPGRKGSPAWVKWLPHAGQILFCELLDGGTSVSTVDVATGKSIERWRDLGDDRLRRGSPQPQDDRCPRAVGGRERWKPPRVIRSSPGAPAGNMDGPDRKLAPAHGDQPRREAALGPGGESPLAQRRGDGGGIFSSIR